MRPKPSPDYLAGYPTELVARVGQLIAQGKVADLLRQRYPKAHEIRTDKALYDYVQQLKGEFLRTGGPLSKVAYDSRLQVMEDALGTHTRISRNHGGKLKAKREIRIAGIFRDMPEEFLRMIVVHELAHLKEQAHDKAFYQLCQHMEADYATLEFDLRVYLSYVAAGGEPLWSTGTPD